MGCATNNTQQSLEQNETSRKSLKHDENQQFQVNSVKNVESVVSLRGGLPGKLLHSEKFGKYIVADKDFAEGDLIWEEYPLIVSAGSNVPELHTGNFTCLSCYRRCKSKAQCTKCFWPICGFVCEEAYLHSNYECKILKTQKVELNPQCPHYDYVSIKILRCLLLSENDPLRWNSLINNHDAQYSNRTNDQSLAEMRNYVLDFLFYKCQLGSKYDIHTVDTVIGIMATNEFCLGSDSNRDALLLFDKASYFSHSCSPNMDAIWIFHPTSDSSYNQNYFLLKFFACRNISKNETLTHSYIYYSDSVIYRQKHLSKIYYFKCDCNICRTDLFDELPYKS